VLEIPGWYLTMPSTSIRQVVGGIELPAFKLALFVPFGQFHAFKFFLDFLLVHNIKYVLLGLPNQARLRATFRKVSDAGTCGESTPPPSCAPIAA